MACAHVDMCWVRSTTARPALPAHLRVRAEKRAFDRLGGDGGGATNHAHDVASIVLIIIKVFSIQYSVAPPELSGAPDLQLYLITVCGKRSLLITVPCPP